MKSMYLSESQIRAMQAGTLAQVWLPMKVQPPSDRYEFRTCVSSTNRDHEKKPHSFAVREGMNTIARTERFSAPYLPGDTLAVKEAWSVRYGMAYSSASVPIPLFEAAEVTYQDGSARDVSLEGSAFAQGETEVKYGNSSPEKRSPITMPTWAVRYRLKVVSAEMKRVQEITEDDSVASGVLTDEQYGYLADSSGVPCPICKGHGVIGCVSLAGAFEATCHECLTIIDRAKLAWNSRYGKKPGLSWNDNPWCWVCCVEKDGIE